MAFSCFLVLAHSYSKSLMCEIKYWKYMANKKNFIVLWCFKYIKVIDFIFEVGLILEFFDHQFVPLLAIFHYSYNLHLFWTITHFITNVAWKINLPPFWSQKIMLKVAYTFLWTDKELQFCKKCIYNRWFFWLCISFMFLLSNSFAVKSM